MYHLLNNNDDKQFFKSQGFGKVHSRRGRPGASAGLSWGSARPHRGREEDRSPATSHVPLCLAAPCPRPALAPRPSLSGTRLASGEAMVGTRWGWGSSCPQLPPRQTPEHRDRTWGRSDPGSLAGVSACAPNSARPATLHSRPLSELASPRGWREALWAGAAGSGHPWLIWGKPAICWAHGDPSTGSATSGRADTEGW